MKFFKGTQFLVIFLGCIFLVNIQFDEKCDFRSSEEHLHIQLQIAEQFQPESEVWRAAGKGGDTNPYNQNPALVAAAFLTRSQSKVFHSGSKGLFKVSGEGKRRRQLSAVLSCLKEGC